MARRKKKKPRGGSSRPSLNKDETQEEQSGRPPSKAELRKLAQEAIEIRTAEMMVELQVQYRNNQAMWGGNFEHYLKHFRTKFKSVVSTDYRKEMTDLDIVKMIKKINTEEKLK